MNATPAASVTRGASTQSYYTIRFLADRGRVEDAYRAYGYFRWVDDTLDTGKLSNVQRAAFFERQRYLLEQCYRGNPPDDVSVQESMLVELVQHDQQKNSGLHIYLRNMMQLMDFDLQRRARLISQVELDRYTRLLASAVTECIHYFVGHDAYSPRDSTRYMAVSAAHIAHMLRDTFEDTQLGYYNVPREVLQANGIGPLDVGSDTYRAWVKSRVQLAREYFEAGKGYFARVENLRCRLACFAYIARFEWLLDTIEREGYLLRPQYGERRSVGTGLQMTWLTLNSMLNARAPRAPASQAARGRHEKA